MQMIFPAADETSATTPRRKNSRTDSPAPALPNAIHNPIGFFRVRNVIHQHVRARSPERQRASLADPGVRSGDERFLILERFKRVRRVVHDEKMRSAE